MIGGSIADTVWFSTSQDARLVGGLSYKGLRPHSWFAFFSISDVSYRDSPREVRELSIKSIKKFCKCCVISKNMEAHQLSTQRLSSKSCRLPSLKCKHELNPSCSDQQAAKEMQYINPDTLLPSIEPESYLELDLIFNEDHPDIKLRSAPIFIGYGVIVGFWYTDRGGNGKRPVYCFIKEDFKFAYWKGDSFILTTDDDFDLLDDIGDWLDEYTEDKYAMTPEAVKVWAEMMWESRVYAGTQGMTLEY
ncbi:hypothetical protein EIK77_010173 [Talaromyces pinophilus]|nr:hypothetical protein EIK77_010173 [Talaromyces pinophilus]